jgi:hypothetical protein
MSKHKTRPHSHDHHSGNHGGAASPVPNGKTKIHHDWRFWVAISLMLLAMLAYVLSFDESLRPGGIEEPAVPAMAE